MKKIILVVVMFMSLWVVSSVAAAPLKVGDKAADFRLKDTTGKEWSLASPEWKGKVILINATSTGEIKSNSALSDMVIRDSAIDKVNKYAAFVVVFSPSSFMKTMLGRAQKGMGKVFMIDEDSAVVKLWGLDEKTSNMIVLDKDRVCRYIYKGKVPNEKYAEVIEVIKTYQAK